jgi:hypothetical protein
MRKIEKPSVAPLFIAELANVAGGGRGRTTTIVPRSENPIGTSRTLGEEGNPPDGISE